MSREAAKGLMQLWLSHLLLPPLPPIWGRPAATGPGICILLCNFTGKGDGGELAVVGSAVQVPTGSQDLFVQKVVMRKHSCQFLGQYQQETKLAEQCPGDSQENPTRPPKL